jgi:hypothetical protein
MDNMAAQFAAFMIQVYAGNMNITPVTAPSAPTNTSSNNVLPDPASLLTNETAPVEQASPTIPAVTAVLDHTTTTAYNYHSRTNNTHNTTR